MVAPELETVVRRLSQVLADGTSSTPDVQLLRSVISNCWKSGYDVDGRLQEELLDLVVLLLEGLAGGTWPLEEQLLSSTALCTCLGLAVPQHDAVLILCHCLRPVDSPTRGPLPLTWGRICSLSVAEPKGFQLALCHGLLQCRPGHILQGKSGAVYTNLLLDVFCVLQLVCRQYSRLTIIAFRALARWLQVVGEVGEAGLVDDAVARAIFGIVNNNWESPIAGIRKENIRILELLMDLSNSEWDETKLLPTVLREQPWKMKSKYLMLAVLLPRYGVVTALSDFPELAPALVWSVQHPHLVSAGCDTYRACLKHIHQQDVWSCFFLEPIVQLLTTNEDYVGKQNLHNYWLKPSIKSFPKLLADLLRQLVASLDNGNSSVLLPTISLVHLGRKEGLIGDLWDSDWAAGRSMSWRVDFLTSALLHSDENVRNHAFGAVCVSSKALSFPTEQEFGTVKHFLAQNASTDSAPLRQGILSSFVCFLLRLRDSFLHEMKNLRNDRCYPSTLSRSLEFLEWLHTFCVSNLKPGANYQRKILSLRLFQEVLRYLDDGDDAAVDAERKKGVRRKGCSHGVRVKDHAMQCNKWGFNSQTSHKCLLDCLLDPTDDIRETAGLILVGHFCDAGQLEDTERLMKKALDLCSSNLFYETESGALMLDIAASTVHSNPQRGAASIDVNLLVSRLAYSEPSRKVPTQARFKTKETFRKFNFFDKSQEPGTILDDKENTILSKENEEEDEMAMFSPAARKLLAALTVRERRLAKYLNMTHKYDPGTFEGLKVQDAETMAKVTGVDASALPETFEGLTVIHPRTGEVGQELNFPRPVAANRQASSERKQSHLPVNLRKKDFWGEDTGAKGEEPCLDRFSFEGLIVRDAYQESESVGGAVLDPVIGHRTLSPNVVSHGNRSSNSPVHSRNSEDCGDPSIPSYSLFEESSRRLWESPIQTVKSIPDLKVPVNGGRNFPKRKRNKRRFKASTLPDESLFSDKVEAPSGRRPRRRRPPRRMLTATEVDGKLRLEVSNLRLLDVKERMSVSPAPSLDWDNCGEPLTLQEEPASSDGDGDGVAAVLGGWGEEEWWEMSSPTTVVGLLLYHAWTQWRALSKDVRRASCGGSPLHGLLAAITRLLARDVPVTSDESREIVALLEDVVHHLLKVLASKANRTSVAPSFAEMSEAIEEAIQQPSSTTVSPAHQLVLNCMWLNLKACCMLASELVRNKGVAAELVKRCEQVIVQVLLRCRHKGAIEAAGVALAGFTKTVTSPEETRVLCGTDRGQTDVKQLPALLLAQFLESLGRGTDRVSTTRRTAGLAILVHRIVTNDMQPGKPLVEKCVLRLLALARSPLQCSPAQLEHLKCDLPQAQALHFLTTLMRDSGLRQDMAPYVCDIALLCFHNFTSPVWTIRNGALQLFGALVPRLIGEKKFQEEELECYGNITVEELFSHYPRLATFLLQTLEEGHHSSLVPVLSLLSKLSVGGYSLMEDSLKEMLQTFNGHFINLLSSKIFAVRKTAAKAFARFVELPKVMERIVMFIKVLSQEQPNENETHGILLVLQYLKERLLSECGAGIAPEEELRKLFDISFMDSVSWLNKALVVELCGVGFVTYSGKGNACPSLLLKQVLYTLKLHTGNSKHTAGIYHWALFEAEIVFRNCREEDLCQVWLTCYDSNWDELGIKFLYVLKQRKEWSLEKKMEIFNTLLNVVLGIYWIKSYNLLFHIYRTLFMLVTEHGLGREVGLVSIQMLHLRNGARKEIGIHCWSVLLPLTCALISVQPEDTIKQQIVLLYQITHHIAERTDAAKFEETCRLDAARAFCLMYRTVQRIFTAQFRTSRAPYESLLVAQDIGEMVLDAGIAFLQDEDEEVRKEAAGFVDNPLNPVACLERLLEPASILELLSRQQAMTYLCTKLMNLESCKRAVKDTSSCNATSPFDHGTSNIYAEEISVVHLLGRSLLLLIQDADDQMKYELDMLLPISLVQEDLNTVLSYAYHGKKSGVISSTARAAFHVVDEKLKYLLRVKLVLSGQNVENLRHIIEVYQEHLREL